MNTKHTERKAGEAVGCSGVLCTISHLCIKPLHHFTQVLFPWYTKAIKKTIKSHIWWAAFAYVLQSTSQTAIACPHIGKTFTFTLSQQWDSAKYSILQSWQGLDVKTARTLTRPKFSLQNGNGNNQMVFCLAASLPKQTQYTDATRNDRAENQQETISHFGLRLVLYAVCILVPFWAVLQAGQWWITRRMITNSLHNALAQPQPPGSKAPTKPESGESLPMADSKGSGGCWLKRVGSAVS